MHSWLYIIHNGRRILGLYYERKIPKVTELETIHASAEQQEEMERLLKKNSNE
jgi:hypothetical protein